MDKLNSKAMSIDMSQVVIKDIDMDKVDVWVDNIMQVIAKKLQETNLHDFNDKSNQKELVQNGHSDVQENCNKNKREGT